METVERWQLISGLLHLSMSGCLPVPMVQSKGCVGSQVKLVSWGDRAAKWADGARGPEQCKARSPWHCTMLS